MIFFAHANGFPAKTYSHFFELLQPHEIRYINCLGMGKYPSYKNWKLLADELIEYIESEKLGKVTGIGHSLGGVAIVFAARKRPDLFDKLIIMDPPFFHPSRSFFIPFVTAFGQGHRIPIAGKAMKRREHFPNKTEAKSYFATKRLFKPFHPQSLDNYVQYGLKESEDQSGVELVIPARVEASFFMNTPGIGRKTIFPYPTYLLHSTSGEVLREKDIRWLKKRLPKTDFQAMEGGHMFPLEFPEETAAVLKRLLA
jgi:pimeloyl-ACP methyl ester carboxylesterase